MPSADTGFAAGLNMGSFPGASLGALPARARPFRAPHCTSRKDTRRAKNEFVVRNVPIVHAISTPATGG